MSEESKKKFAELNMTKDEMHRFSEAMKKEEFRKLLVEYAEELSDPANRELYEKEIAQLEQERGMDVTFIHPEKGFCIKTTKNGSEKCFINICKNSNIDKPKSSTQSSNQNGKVTQGLMWEIPHTCSPSREDYDHNKNICSVYDVVFHPDSYRMGETNERFKTLLKDSAMDTIEKSFNLKLDRVNAKVLKNIKFKGNPTACVIKKKSENFNPNTNEDTNDPIKPLIDQIKEHSLDKKLDERLNKKSSNKVETSESVKPNENNEPAPTHTTPKYSIIHRGIPDMSDHANQLDNKLITSTRPKELYISIELPLLKSSQDVDLDVFESSLELNSDSPNYKLNLKLPFPVRETEARAKFDKSKRCLNVTLPVKPYVGKLDTASDFTFPISSDSSVSNSSSSISDLSFTTIPPKDLDQAVKNNIKNNIKYTLPTKCQISETRNYISFKFYINNYVKESIQIQIDSESTLEVKCESCSASGCYVQYYSAFVQLNLANIDHELISEARRSIKDFDGSNTASFNFIDDDFFELKLKKSSASRDNSKPNTAFISLEKSADPNDDSRQTIQIEEDSIEENMEESLISESKVNNMSRKDYITNFKDIVSGKTSEDNLDEDDDLEPLKETVKSIKRTNVAYDANEKIKLEQRKSARANQLSEKIDEETEFREKEEEKITDYEKEYLQNQFDSLNEETNEENDDINDKQSRSGTSSLSSFTNDSSMLGSSLNSSSSNHLKGILKKPRSVSESESNLSFKQTNQSKMPEKTNELGNSYDSNELAETNNSTSEDNLHNSKKSVHFNNQVVRNVFKSNSTVIGMKKPNPNKNRKKNQRKRTISDPSFDSDYSNLRDNNSSSSSGFRNRSISESSDDNSNVTPNSENSTESINEDKNKENQNKSKNRNKKKNKKKNKNSNEKDKQTEKPEIEEESKTEDKAFNVETMLQWKNQGLLPDDNEVKHATECSFKFKNKVINDLDD